MPRWTTTPAMIALLLLVLQVPSLRAFAKHGGALAPVLAPAALVGAMVLFAWLLGRPGRGPRLPWPVIVGGWLVAVLAVSVWIYPMADALKSLGQGSDQDDAVIQAAARLLVGADPYDAPSYLGLPISAGPGLVIAAVPFVAAGFYPGLTLAALGLAVAMLVRRQGWPAAGLFALLLASSLAFWELIAIGSDLIAVGSTFLAISLAADSGSRTRAGGMLLAAAAGAAATSRVVFLYLPLVWALPWLRRRPCAGAGFAAASLTVAVLLHAGFALWADRPYPPLHLLGKGAGLLDGAGALFVLPALAGIVASGVAALRGNALAALAFALTGPLAAVAFAHLAAVGWALPLWTGASYLGAAMPAVAAWAAIRATEQVRETLS